MGKSLNINTEAPDFVLKDTQDREIRLSDFRGEKIIVLVLNRGFV